MKLGGYVYWPPSHRVCHCCNYMSLLECFHFKVEIHCYMPQQETEWHIIWAVVWSQVQHECTTRRRPYITWRLHNACCHVVTGESVNGKLVSDILRLWKCVSFMEKWLTTYLLNNLARNQQGIECIWNGYWDIEMAVHCGRERHLSSQSNVLRVDIFKHFKHCWVSLLAVFCH